MQHLIHVYGCILLNSCKCINICTMATIFSHCTQNTIRNTSAGIVFGVGVAMVREASTVMLGNYFKRRRQFVEMVAMSGEGVGIALFSVILKEGVGKAGWRLGLQIVAALTALSFFMGLMYRPASLYHPQRRAIQHLKNQRKKVGNCVLCKVSVLICHRPPHRGHNHFPFSDEGEKADSQPGCGEHTEVLFSGHIITEIGDC